MYDYFRKWAEFYINTKYDCGGVYVFIFTDVIVFSVVSGLLL